MNKYYKALLSALSLFCCGYGCSPKNEDHKQVPPPENVQKPFVAPFDMENDRGGKLPEKNY